MFFTLRVAVSIAFTTTPSRSGMLMPEQHAPQVESLLVLARPAALLYRPCVLDFSAGELRLSTKILM